MPNNITLKGLQDGLGRTVGALVAAFRAAP